MYKPILFNTEMVKAILDGRKHQTRRLVKPNFRSGEYGFQIITNARTGEFVRIEYYDEFENETRWMKQPCEVGDILWVRETWRPAKGTLHTYIRGEVVESDDWHDGFEYMAGGYHFPDGFKESDDVFHLSEIRSEGNWHPSIHMPKEAARIFLRVKNVRVERLVDISEEDAVSEGCYAGYKPKATPWDVPNDTYENKARDHFFYVWEATVKPAERDTYGINGNPWVWVIEFERCERPADF